MLNFILLQITNPTGATGTVADTMSKAASVAATATPPAPAEIQLSVWDLVMKGGWIMIPLAIFMALVIYFAIERLIVISKAAKHNRTIMFNLRDQILNGQVDAARNFVRNMDTPEGRMLEKGISRIGRPTREIEDAMEKVGHQEVARLERNLSVLSLLSRLAPMFGFVGTIMGVIKIFFDMAQQGEISIPVISTGLYQKLITSAAGLLIGLIAFACYHMLNSWIDRITARLEKRSMELVDILNEPAK